ncbi:penicillin-binding protein activator [Roseococcus pinisoli]|uniref:Penicillin-binding protein activator n=1 Tax=Roseococcus pinisoli TaxID=2835040 RepID=A0ABS5QCN6_9PROT|nr:penicillin-binding protein activator [Roseococcus pinisoli]MBS7810363.1 penicillin-binding protein activator [Roseococcus pinisoli]
MRRLFPSGLALASLLLLLIGCAPQPLGGARPQIGGAGAWNGGEAPAEARLRVGVLLPLTGSNAPLGQTMLNAAQLALFDQGDRRIEMLPRDTRSTPTGAAEAARNVLADGAVSLAGPLTLTETAAVVNAARGSQAPVFAFTSDEGQASARVWVLGTTPSQQVRRIVSAASEGGARRFALMAADDAFGRRLAASLREAMQQIGAPPPTVVLTPARADQAAAAQQIAAAQPEAVLIGHGGAAARAAGAALGAAFPGGLPRILGTALWAGDEAIGNEPALVNAWFPAPDPEARRRFDEQYRQAFGDRPSRLAGVAYDALALAARSARDGGPPVGTAFMGADGPVRLLEGGALARGLAIFAVRPGAEAQLIQPAPVPGAAGS